MRPRLPFSGPGRAEVTAKFRAVTVPGGQATTGQARAPWAGLVGPQGAHWHTRPTGASGAPAGGLSGLRADRLGCNQPCY